VGVQGGEAVGAVERLTAAAPAAGCDPGAPFLGQGDVIYVVCVQDSSHTQNVITLTGFVGRGSAWFLAVMAADR
jgi:hypothetical protein